jgi:AcrR family transcriptional regulator
MTPKKFSEAAGTTQVVRNRSQSAPEEKQQRIIGAAKDVFLKYGYNRVTMNDLAKAAGMSRPALYLIFSRKEDIFRGVIRQMAREVSDEVNQGVGAIKSPLEKLKFVCEVWMVRPFDWAHESQEAKEIYESSHEFAQDAVAESMLLFERDLASVIELFPKGALPRGIPANEAAHLMAGAIGGIKTSSRNSVELRKKIHDLIAMMIRT